jgi:hypothetical protein
MNIKGFGNTLEQTAFWKDGFVTEFFNLLPVILVTFLFCIIY